MSVNAGVIDREIAVSSFPETAGTLRVGASAIGLTVTFRLTEVDAVGPVAPSCEVAVTVKAKSTSELAGGVILRPDRFHPRMLTEVLPVTAVKL